MAGGVLGCVGRIAGPRGLPTPGLNAKQEDFDPCVIVLKAGE